jgi:hypothetical protein
MGTRDLLAIILASACVAGITLGGINRLVLRKGLGVQFNRYIAMVLAMPIAADAVSAVLAARNCRRDVLDIGSPEYAKSVGEVPPCAQRRPASRTSGCLSRRHSHRQRHSICPQIRSGCVTAFPAPVVRSQSFLFQSPISVHMLSQNLPVFQQISAKIVSFSAPGQQRNNPVETGGHRDNRGGNTETTTILELSFR